MVLSLSRPGWLPIARRRKVSGVQPARAEQQSWISKDLSVHLTGNFAMQSDISHAVTGFKSVLLKPLDPFLKKRNAGVVIPVAVTGGPGHYKVTQDFSHTK
jgi:hypothetical protein